MIRSSRTRRRLAKHTDRAFTLIELMLSIALVLLLMIGVNYIFKSTSEAVSAGQTINQFSRDDQSAQSILFNDLYNIEKKPPFFGFASRIDTNYQDAADAQSGTNPAIIVTDNGSGTPITIGTDLSPAIYNFRNHRVDLLKFFAHGNFARHSANPNQFSSPTVAADAFITIGQALLPTYDQSLYIGPMTDPLGTNQNVFQLNGATTSSLAPTAVGTSGAWPVAQFANAGLIPPALKRVNTYATDSVLARNVILLKAPETNRNNAGNFIEHNFPVATAANLAATLKYSNGQAWYPYGVNLSPLGYYSPDDQGTTVLQSSRYDYANVTLEQFRRIVADAVLLNNNALPPQSQTTATIYPIWWLPMLYNLGAFSESALPSGAGPASPYYDFGYIDSSNHVQVGTAAAPLNPGLARMSANPLIQTPLTAAAFAQMAPYFIQHCSQFVVEYTGDCLQQDGASLITAGSATPTGQITGIGQDGQIDYVIVTDPNTGIRSKRIRWYGMPRNSSGSPNNFYWIGDHTNFSSATADSITIRGYNPGELSTATFTDSQTYTSPGASHTHNIMEEFVDVIPLRDYYSLFYNTANADTAMYKPAHEVDINFDSTKDYGGHGGATPHNAPVANSNWFNVAFGDPSKLPPRYATAWYNDTPTMIRILIKVDDPNHKVQDGPWYEFVFKLK